MSTPKQIETTILGQSYVLACPEGGERLLQEAVSIVDREMSAIRDAGRVKARERMAVLTALNLAYQRAEQAHLPAPVQAPPPAKASPAAAANDAGPAGDDDALIDQLILRIDTALGDDGHLF